MKVSKWTLTVFFIALVVLLPSVYGIAAGDTSTKPITITSTLLAAGVMFGNIAHAVLNWSHEKINKVGKKDIREDRYEGLMG